jgi:hypothetical protein
MTDIVSLPERPVIGFNWSRATVSIGVRDFQLLLALLPPWRRLRRFSTEK